MPGRRSFLQTLSTMPLIGAFSSRSYASVEKGRDYFKELGVRTVINACGNYTKVTASLMPREVMRAMDYASTRYVRLNDLQDAVGARIAGLVGSEAAMVSSGAASAISLGTAACITGNNADFIRRIPDTSGMKDEVVIPKGHRNNYDHAIRASGGKLVEVATADELERAIGPRTAMLAFFNLREPVGAIKAAEFAEISRRRGVPVLIDAAADVPPVENLSRFIKLGYDLVCISGGKAICGPQSAGLLLGRRDLIEAAKLNTSPNSGSIHRGMKVNKEEILGMLIALESFLKKDHAAEWKEWERRVAVIVGVVNTLEGVSAELWVPPIASHMPHVKVRWDRKSVSRSVKDIRTELSEGDPPIEANPDSEEELILAVFTLKPGEDKIVAARLRAILKGASS
jgi:D-glucosaminate-6-phosphate ammonia-lyase